MNKKVICIALFIILLLAHTSVSEEHIWTCGFCGTVNWGSYCTVCGRLPAESTVCVGDIITFGVYEQDGDHSNGKERIEWIILDKRDDGSLVLLSKYVLACEQYYEGYSGATWETSALRKWLNEDFYEVAFNTPEQARIVPVTIKNEDNHKYGTTGGNDTTDKLWLLSVNEVTNRYRVGTAYSFFTDDASRMCEPTEAVSLSGISMYYFSAETMGGLGHVRWWLRSPGSDLLRAAYVDWNGYVYDYHDPSYDSSVGVRPAVVVLP